MHSGLASNFIQEIYYRIGSLNCWNRRCWYGIDTGPTKLHELMTWHCITLYCCITTTVGKSLTQLYIRINNCINCHRHPIYRKVLPAWVRIVNTLWIDIFRSICCIPIWRVHKSLLVTVRNWLLVAKTSNVASLTKLRMHFVFQIVNLLSKVPF